MPEPDALDAAQARIAALEAELALAERRVAVPLYGAAESLNVGTAATVCLYASAMASPTTRD